MTSMVRDVQSRLPSLLELLAADTDLSRTASSCPDGVVDRRAHGRFEPVGRITLRLDVLGGIWSARVSDVSAESARLRVDPEIAQRIADGQAASIWLESRQGMPVRLDGRLRTLQLPSAAPGDEPVAVAFTRESLGDADMNLV